MALIPIRSLPGVQRDGTQFDRKVYTDAQWCRFQRQLPRKIAGYRAVTSQMPQVVYGMHTFSVNAFQYLHLGSEDQLWQRRLNNLETQVSFNDRTPAGLVGSPSNIWQFDAIYDVDLATTALVAHAAPNMDIASDDEQPIWFGDLTATGALVDTNMAPVSGGVVTVGNYLVSYGSAGYVQWNNVPNNLDLTFDEDFITQQKIVKGLQVRGGGIPAALLWSLDALILQSLAAPGGASLWDWDTLGEISVLSSRGIIEYDGVYYWPGVDRFLSYNGVIREVPNTFNVDFFFDCFEPGAGLENRQKVFAFKVPRFGEIWWCFPRPGSTECNHAVILNVREGYWYDTELPNSGRSEAVSPKVYVKPFMTGVVEGGAGFTLWQHETGTDQVVGSTVEPIPAHFETNEITMITGDQPNDKSISVAVLEPDFVQVGDLTLRVKGRANARAAVIASDPVTISEQQETPAGVDAENQVVRLKQTRRLMSFRFESNTPGGHFQMGQVIAHVDQADGRITQ